MKQIIQSLKNGETTIEEIPVPKVSQGSILIQSTHSLVSLGTEKMLVEFGKSSLISKARQQPEKVKVVLDKIFSEGLLPTLETVFNKLEQPLPLGYCNVGEVIEVGKGVTDFSVGDRVASNGHHAEIISVPQNLAVKIPDKVNNEDATFTVIGSIGLQAVRLTRPQMGELIVVIGLGLIGLMTCQILKAHGCKVLGIDLDKKKCLLAEKLGISTIESRNNDPAKIVIDKTNGLGADGVIISASSSSNNIISQSAQMSRKLGRIVLVGVVGLNINRSDFYEKELTFQVSCSYGPGRYDDTYEQKGLDYPISYVRWTEKRNFETVLNLIKNKSVNVNDLITQRVKLAEFRKIYDKINSKENIASIIKYDKRDLKTLKRKNTIYSSISFSNKKGVLGIIGAGNFTSVVILPSLKKCNAKLKMIASSKGLNSTILAKKYNIKYSTTDYRKILNDKEIDSVIIATRHNSHSKLVNEFLQKGKNVFVEKPLAINEYDLNSIIEVYNEVLKAKKKSTLTVGFNRRFSPHIQKLKRSLSSDSVPINIIINMNAGFISKDHWVNDLEVGGGRIVGEACHLMDLCVYITNSKIVSVCASSKGLGTDLASSDVSMLLKFENGSNAAVNYFSNGSKKYSKERLEVYAHQRTWIIDNYKKTKLYSSPGTKIFRTKIDKGHANQFSQFTKLIEKGGAPLIHFDELVNVTQASFAVIKSLKKNCWVDI